MCFYCHKLYYFPYAPLHDHTTCPELTKINNKQNYSYNGKYQNQTSISESEDSSKSGIFSTNSILAKLDSFLPSDSL